MDSLPRREDATRDRSLLTLVHRWRQSHVVSSGGRQHMTRDERRYARAQQRYEQWNIAAIEEFDDTTQRKKVLLVRHGEALHNVAWKQNRDLLDTRLTERGRAQATSLAGHPALMQCTLLVVSPLSRAIETARNMFGERPAWCRVCLCALLSERCDGDAACNRGSAPSALASLFPFVCSWEGFDSLPEKWWPTTEDDGHDRWSTQRVPAFLSWLEVQPETKVVCVGHGGFFSDERLAGRMLANTEVAVKCRPAL